LTFDYRGIGESRRGSLRGCEADLTTWARQDAAAALAELTRRAGQLPLVWIGHSLGVQILPFVPGHERLAKIVAIATGTGSWHDSPPRLKRWVWLLWYVVVPLSLALCGYFPGAKLGRIGDVPKGAMAQWRRWCLHREYSVGVEGESARAAYAAVSTPIGAISFSDDEYMSERNLEALLGFFSGAPRTSRRFAPADLGMARIGHFGFFRESKRSLWERLLRPEIAGL
jgi:predicted alpha/beta hydrolase